MGMQEQEGAQIAMSGRMRMRACGCTWVCMQFIILRVTSCLRAQAALDSGDVRCVYVCPKGIVVS